MLPLPFLLLLVWLGVWLHGNRAKLALRLIDTRLHRGDYQGALRLLDRLQFLVAKPLFLHKKALILVLGGREPEAEAPLREALRLTQAGARYRRERLYATLGYALADMGRADEAEAAFEQAIRAGDVTGNSQNGLALVRRMQGRLADSVAFAEQAVAIAARRINRRVHPVLHSDRALALALAGRADEARAVLAQVAVGDNAVDHACLEWKAGLTFLALNQSAEAIQHFRNGSASDPHGQYGRRCREELARAGAAPSPSTVPPFRMRPWWRPVWKPGFTVAALLIFGAIACPLVMRVRPGTLPDFRSSGRAYRFAANRWSEIAPYPGGLENIQVSPTGILWAVTPARDLLLRWDGAHWTGYPQRDLRAFALQDEDVWVLTRSAVRRFDGRTWQDFPEALRSSSAAAIAAGPSGVWVADRKSNIAHFEGRSWRIEDLHDALPAVDWEERIQDAAPELRVTADGSVWLLMGGFWRRGDGVWREIPISNVDWERAAIAGQNGANLWLYTPGWIFEVEPSGDFGRVFNLAKLPLPDRPLFARIATSGGRTWLATPQDLLVSDGAAWRHRGIPAGTSNLKEVAAAPGEGAWAVIESGPTWRIALWVAPPLIAGSIALLIIGLLLAMWANSSAQAQFASQRAILAVAGGAPGWDDAAQAAAIQRRGRWLLFAVPAFLVLFPVAFKAISWGQIYFRGQWPDAPEWLSWAAALSPLAIAAGWFVVTRLRDRSPSIPFFGIEVRATLFLAVACFLLSRLAVPYASLISSGVLVAALFLFFSRDSLAKRLTMAPVLAGKPERALARLRWLALGSPSAYMLSLEAAIHSTAGRNKEAEQCLRRALVLGARASTQFRCKALSTLGLVLAETQRYEEAQRCLEAVVGMGDPGGHARAGLAATLLFQGREADKALGLIEESIRIGQNRLVAADRQADRAWAFALLGRTAEMDEAIAAAMGALASSPRLAVAAVHWKIGRTLLIAQRETEAIEHFRATVSADPGGGYARLAQKELEERVKKQA